MCTFVWTSPDRPNHEHQCFLPDTDAHAVDWHVCACGDVFKVDKPLHHYSPQCTCSICLKITTDRIMGIET